MYYGRADETACWRKKLFFLHFLFIVCRKAKCCDGYARYGAKQIFSFLPQAPSANTWEMGCACGHTKGLSARPLETFGIAFYTAGYAAGIALGVQDSRPLLPTVARPTSPSIHRATPAALRLLVFRRWVEIATRHGYKTKGTDKKDNIPIDFSRMRCGYNVSLSLVLHFSSV